MENAIRAFVTFLELQRGASPETIRAYRSDLRQFLFFALQHGGSSGAPLRPEDVRPNLPRRIPIRSSFLHKETEETSDSGQFSGQRSFFLFLTVQPSQETPNEVGSYVLRSMHAPTFPESTAGRLPHQEGGWQRNDEGCMIDPSPAFPLRPAFTAPPARGWDRSYTRSK